MWAGWIREQLCLPSGEQLPCRTACRMQSSCGATLITCRSCTQAPRPTQVTYSNTLVSCGKCLYNTIYGSLTAILCLLRCFSVLIRRRGKQGTLAGRDTKHSTAHTLQNAAWTKLAPHTSPEAHHLPQRQPELPARDLADPTKCFHVELPRVSDGYVLAACCKSSHRQPTFCVRLRRLNSGHKLQVSCSNLQPL